jgi:hypothetical protein
VTPPSSPKREVQGSVAVAVTNVVSPPQPQNAPQESLKQQNSTIGDQTTTNFIKSEASQHTEQPSSVENRLRQEQDEKEQQQQQQQHQPEQQPEQHEEFNNIVEGIDHELNFAQPPSYPPPEYNNNSAYSTQVLMSSRFVTDPASTLITTPSSTMGSVFAPSASERALDERVAAILARRNERLRQEQGRTDNRIQVRDHEGAETMRMGSWKAGGSGQDDPYCNGSFESKHSHSPRMGNDYMTYQMENSGKQSHASHMRQIDSTRDKQHLVHDTSTATARTKGGPSLLAMFGDERAIYEYVSVNALALCKLFRSPDYDVISSFTGKVAFHRMSIDCVFFTKYMP